LFPFPKTPRFTFIPIPSAFLGVEDSDVDAEVPDHHGADSPVVRRRQVRFGRKQQLSSSSASTGDWRLSNLNLLKNIFIIF
jgi:hypothetical protein